jgi:hypothetical protein
VTAALPPEVEARQVAALGLARQGFAIAQCYGVRRDGRCSCGKDDCAAPGKHGGPGWLEQATTDPNVIRRRFLRGAPNYGVDRALARRQRQLANRYLFALTERERILARLAAIGAAIAALGPDPAA